MSRVIYGDVFHIKFANHKGKGERMREEWRILFPLLRGAILATADYVVWAKMPIGHSMTRFHTGLTLTCIYRTKEENDAEKDSKPNSKHMRNRAADIRIHGFSQSQLAEIARFWIKEIREYDPRLQIHPKGNHIHVEFDDGS